MSQPELGGAAVKDAQRNRKFRCHAPYTGNSG